MKKTYMKPQMGVVVLNATMNLMAGSATGTHVYGAAGENAAGLGREDDMDWDDDEY